MTEDRGFPDERPPLLPWKLVGLVVVAGLALLFALQNRNRTPVQFLFWEVNSRQWVSIAVAIALGVLLDRLFQAWWRRRRT